MRHLNRKSTPKVKAGRVQKKNNWTESPNYYNTWHWFPVIVRRRPGEGHRHVLTRTAIYRFTTLLPNAEELFEGLSAIVLAPAEEDTAGYHVPGAVHICAWGKDLWQVVSVGFYEEHSDIFERLEVPCVRVESGYLCKWTEPKVRAYQLLHILLHELGHHHDRMTTKSKVRASRGEPYAEAYARKYEAKIWVRYLEEFGLF
jgi:hypothetical protein